MLTSLKRIVHSGLEKFSRDRSSTGAAFVVMCIVLFVVSILFILQGMSAFLIQELTESVDVSAYFKDEVAEEEMFRVRDAAAAREEVVEVEYISKDEALRRFIEAHEGQEAILNPLQALGTNPLRAHLNLKAREPEDYPKIAEFLSEGEFAGAIEKVDFFDRAPVIERLSQLTSGIRTGVAAVSIVFSIIALLVAFNTIRLTIYSSKEEIEIMRLVGASNWFIRGPLLVQGVLVGAAATAGTLVLLFLLGFLVGGKLESFSGFSLSPFLLSNFLWLLLLCLAVGIGLGLASAAIAINRYLKI